MGLPCGAVMKIAFLKASEEDVRLYFWLSF